MSMWGCRRTALAFRSISRGCSKHQLYSVRDATVKRAAIPQSPRAFFGTTSKEVLASPIKTNESRSQQPVAVLSPSRSTTLALRSPQQQQQQKSFSFAFPSFVRFYARNNIGGRSNNFGADVPPPARENSWDDTDDEKSADFKFEQQQLSSEAEARARISSSTAAAFNDIIMERNMLELTREIENRPLDPTLFTQRGVLFMELEQYEEAMKDFERALMLDPQKNVKAEIYYYRGLIHEATGKQQQALNDFSYVIQRVDGGYAPAYVARANLLSKYPKYWQQCIDDYTKAIALDPSNAQTYSFRADTYLDMKNYKAAIEDVEKAIEYNPKDPDPYLTRGNVYREMEKYDKAIEDFTTLIELDERDPSEFRGYLNRGNVYMMTNNVFKAIEDYNKVIEINPEFSDAYFGLGVAYETLGKTDEAMNCFNRAIEIDPNNFRAYAYRGNLFAREKNDTWRALNDLNRSIQINASYPKAYIYRGGLYLILNQDEEALADLKKGLSAEPRDLQALSHIGTAFTKLGMIDEAIGAYTTAMQHTPKNADPSFHLRRGMLLSEHKTNVEDLNMALADLTTYIQMYADKKQQDNNSSSSSSSKTKTKNLLEDPNFVLNQRSLGHAYVARARAYHKLGQTKKAERDLKRALELNPTDEAALKLQDKLKYGDDDEATTTTTATTTTNINDNNSYPATEATNHNNA